MTTNENIFVVTPQGEQLAIEFDAADTIENLKAKIEAAQGTPAVDQRLAYGGKLLEDGHALADYNIAKEAQIGLSVKLEGGFWSAFFPSLAAGVGTSWLTGGGGGGGGCTVF